MTPQHIKDLRSSLKENTRQFASRFARSARTVEDWEQGRRNPDPLAVAEMGRIAAKLAGKKSRKIS